LRAASRTNVSTARRSSSGSQHHLSGPVRWPSAMARATSAGTRPARRRRSSSESLMVNVAESALPITWIQQSFRLPTPYSQAQRQLAPMKRTVSPTSASAVSPARSALKRAAAAAGRSCSGAVGRGSAASSA